MSREIALFGGSFNPAHQGHVFVVAQVLAVEAVDEVWLVPTHTHAFGKDLAPFDDRLAMCEAIAALFGDRVRVSEVEATLAAEGRPNWTVETLAHLTAEHPDDRFALVIGTDLLDQIDRWREPERLRSLARLVVVNRAGRSRPQYGPTIPDVSSTWIRDQIRRGAPVDGWVPRRVADLIEARGLYR